jgi:hypothetical protein
MKEKEKKEKKEQENRKEGDKETESKKHKKGMKREIRGGILRKDDEKNIILKMKKMKVKRRKLRTGGRGKR